MKFRGLERVETRSTLAYTDFGTLVRFLLLCIGVLLSPTGPALADTAANTPLNLIQNSTFSTSGGAVTDWSQINPAVPATIGSDNGEAFIAVAAPDDTVLSGMTQVVPVRPEWSKVLLRGSIRVVVNAQSPQSTNAPSSLSQFIGVDMTWLDSTGKIINSDPPQSWTQTTPGWVDVNELIAVPSGAVSLVISPQVNHESASAFFEGLSLVAFVSTLDEGFTNNTLDPALWSVTTGKHNVSSYELQWFSPDEVSVANNMLRIHAEQTLTNGFPYKSGQISTIGKFQQLYGLFEFQLKVPVVNGAWAAAYLLAWNDDWPPEIDVEEIAGDQPNEVINTNHYTDEYGEHRQSDVNYSAIGIDRTQWHTYSVVWEPGEVAWYLDDNYRGTTGQPYNDASSVPMYITINLALGGFGGDPSQSTWPQDLYCRHVNVYQRSDLSFPLYPEPSQEITLPVNSATLSAVSAYPASSFVTTWSLAEGPAPVKIVAPHNITTTAYFTKPGMYIFSVKVSKGEMVSTGRLLVYVNSALGKS